MFTEVNIPVTTLISARVKRVSNGCQTVSLRKLMQCDRKQTAKRDVDMRKHLLPVKLSHWHAPLYLDILEDIYLYTLTLRYPI